MRRFMAMYLAGVPNLYGSSVSDVAWRFPPYRIKRNEATMYMTPPSARRLYALQLAAASS